MNREKVINTLEEIKTQTAEIGLDRAVIAHKFIDEILALLKEQEPVEPRKVDGKRNHFIKCGNCNYDLMTGFQFCSHCGRSVK